MRDIDSFSGEHRWLSNFWPCLVNFEGHIYPSVEHAYQAAKFHPSQRAKFRADIPPGKAKRLGQGSGKRDEWEQIKEHVMTACLREKFSHESDLAGKLLATGTVMLIEGNTWGDRYWGVCRGEGENRLGVLLMNRRDELRLSHA